MYKGYSHRSFVGWMLASAILALASIGCMITGASAQTTTGGGGCNIALDCKAKTLTLATPLSVANGGTGGTTSTGTGAVVRSVSPALITPNLGVPSAIDLTHATNLPLTAVTGVLPAANGGAGTITGALKGNGSGTVSQAAASDLSNGVNGSGAVVLTTNPALVTPAIGVATGTSLALNGATLGSNKLAVSGSIGFGSNNAFDIGDGGGVGAARNIFAGTLVSSNGNYALTSDTGSYKLGASSDVVLTRDAANSLALRNGTNAQALKVYRTYTDGVNNAGFGITYSGNNVLLQGFSAGTGNPPNVYLLTNSSSAVVNLGVNSTTNWTINGSGNLVAGTDNTYDIGATGATRPKNVWVAGTVNAGGNITTGGSILLSGGSGNVKLTGITGNILQIGSSDQTAPVAQTITAQNVIAGTSNTASPNFTIAAPMGTGTGVGGSLVFQVSPAGSTGSTQNALATALTIASTKDATFTGNILAAGTITANNGATGSGQMTGTTIGFSSRSSLSSPVDSQINLSNNAGTNVLKLGIGGSNAWLLGGLDTATPSAQSVMPQKVLAGTTNTAGANLTIAAGIGTGTGAGGSLILQVAPAGTTGSTQNALVTALTIDSSKTAQFAGDVGGANWQGTAQIRAGATSGIFWSGRSDMKSAADGDITISNNADTSFNMLKFGGITSSFPALKRVFGALQVRLADDSAYADLAVNNITVNGTCTGCAGGTVSRLQADSTATSGTTAPGWAKLYVPAFSANDTTTTGTNSIVSGYWLDVPTFTATNARTYTNAASLYVNNAPTCSTNTTCTTKYAILAGTGDIGTLSGNIKSSGNISTATGTVSGATVTGAFVTASGLLLTTPQLFSAISFFCGVGSGDGYHAFITDSTVTAYGAAVAGGGSNHAPIWCDGGAGIWKVG